MRAIIVHSPGGPEQLKLEEVPRPAIGPGQVLVKVAAIGVNFIDIYHRTGLYKSDWPASLGLEGAGTVESVGPDVTQWKAGDRVAWAMARGSYAEYVAAPANQLIRMPDTLDFPSAAAAMLQGMTAHYLTHSTWPLKQGETALIHAAAGGTGRLVVQMAKLRGARVLAVVSTDEKAKVAREAGADEVIVYTRQDFETEVKRLTDGKGVDVVYDSVGASTFQKSLNVIRRRGMMVTFGNASGPVPPVEPLLLSQKGSLFLTRPTLFDYTATREELEWRATDVLNWVAAGKLKLQIGATYPLANAADAHRALEGRQTTGKLLLTP
ncbi:MAG: quinone oxidoreductase [Bryobacteraceae bacterium]|nr:quinone oxidoreductase [Bryobacteraceae bacterium]